MRIVDDLAQLPPTYDLAVVGAGPAGMAAAVAAGAHGLSVAVIDENAAVGGQIYRGISAPATPPAVLGADYWRGEALAAAFHASTVDYLPRTTVWYLDEARCLGVSAHGTSRLFEAKRVILAGGALERSFPVKGWTNPGVLTVGAAQALLKTAGLVAGKDVVLAGSGPLLWLLAAQYLRAGRVPKLILDTTPAANWRQALPQLPAFLLSPYALKGLRLVAAVRRAVRVVEHVAGLEIAADGERHVVTYRCAEGEAQTVSCDHVLLHQGVVPEINLPAAAGCALAWDAAQACFRPELDGWGDSSVAGIAIAGDAGGIAGAESAAAAGYRAGLNAACALGAIDRAGRDRLAAPHAATLRRYGRGRAFLDAMYRPAAAMRQAGPEVIACRCEEVTGAQITEATTRLGVGGPNQMKAFLRCGMGPCQGRLCGLTVTETIAAARGVSPAEVGYYRPRAPVKPITVAELAGMPRTEAETRAVARG